MDNNCIFCKIINKELPSKTIFESENIIAFKDIYPKAPVHILIVPKVHIPSVNNLELKDGGLIGEMVLTAQKIAREQKLDEKGYRLILNVGKDAGQTVDHLHLHLLGGGKLPFA